MLGLQRSDGGRLDPAAFRLERIREPRVDPADARVGPTGASLDGDVLRLRFNVMQGPRRSPLDPGPWRLIDLSEPGSISSPVVGRHLELGRFEARFPLSNGEYRVSPDVDAAGRFTLDVEFAAGAGELATVGGPWRLLRPLSRLVRTARRGLYRSMLRVIRLVAPRDGRRVLFTSDSRDALSGNLKIVHDAMVEKGLDREYELLTLFRPNVTSRRPLLDRFRLIRLLARADMIVIDDFQPVIYSLDDLDVRIVQLWHAVGSFKTVGYSRVGKTGAPNPFGNAHKNYSYAIVSAAGDVPFYAEAFGIPEERVIATGIPRVDRFFDESRREAARAAGVAEFPQARGRTTILYAPTFRGNGARSATFDFERLDLETLHQVCIEKDAVCIIRMHPFVREPLSIPESMRDRIVDGSATSMDVNDLLFLVDLLVTDYSSIVFEYSTLGRPMLFYAYDLEEYIASRDFYEPYETFVPGRIVRTFDALADAIRRDDYEQEKVAPFAARHFAHLDGRSTDRVIDLILGR